MSTRILEELIYKGNESRFEPYGISKDEIEMIKNMIERSNEFVSS